MITPKAALKMFQLCLSFILIGLSSLQARAGDYEVAYAIDALGLTEDGTSRECTYKSPCHLTLAKSRISITIFSERYLQRMFTVRIGPVGLDLAGCCYFNDGDDSVMINVGGKLFHRLAIFVGRRRKGDEYVLNKKIGELYLEFRNLKPSPQHDPRRFSRPPYRT